MDIFDWKYYKINKNLNRSLGCWPYQKSMEKYIARFIVLSILMSGFIPGLIKIYKVRNDIHELVNCLPMLMGTLLLLCKYFIHTVTEYKFIKLFDMIKDNWRNVESKHDEIIMHKHAEIGRNVSFIMMTGYYTTMIMYSLLPMVPIVMNVWHPMNESRELIYIFQLDYLVEPDNYLVIIYIHQYIVGMIGITTIVAADGTYGIYAFHACGMFDIVSTEFVNLPFQHKSHDGLGLLEKKRTIEDIGNAIEKHKKAIQFSDTIESTYVYLVLVIFGLGIGSISISGVQMLLYFDNPLEEIRYCLICVSYFLHIFYYTWNGQNIFDYSYKIYKAGYNANWYEVLDETSRLLTIVILRSSKPCLQTAGKVFPLNLMSYTMIVKTSMSYFTVLANFQ